MRRTTGRYESEAKSGKIEEACMRYGIGESSMRKVAEEAGAVIRIGRLYLVNYSKVDKYLDDISE